MVLAFDMPASAGYECGMKPGRTTLRQIAEAAGVSLNTVSLALRESPRLNKATRERIRTLATAMGYVPNPVLSAGMAQLRHRTASEVGAVLALVHIGPRRELLRWAANRMMAGGVESRARELGYRLEWMELQDSAASENRLLRRLTAMGMPGTILIGLPFGACEQRLGGLIAHGPVVSCGLRIDAFNVHMAQSDHFNGARTALKEVIKLGYRRPGLIIHRAFDAQIEHTITGGYLAQLRASLPEAAPLVLSDWPAAAQQAAVRDWARAHRPDVVLTSEKQIPAAEWHSLLGRDTALVQLGLTDETPGWAGVTYPGIGIGRTTVELLVAQIHRGESGAPPFQICSLAEGTWEPASTCPPRRH